MADELHDDSGSLSIGAGPKKNGRTISARRLHPGPRTGHNLQVLFDIGRKLAKSGGLDKRSIFWLPMRKIWA
ncbi:hypothetical protein [Aminobacter aminovorans]|uniref:hypothetical protein n=1 Tax=Aminobacter aminovorans TaxID=83263 RepID=UPI001047AE8A|nr:hypothetical protein [Aminobacter aminovorans]